MKTEEKTIVKKTTKQGGNKVFAKDRIKPRGLAGLYKGKIMYDKNADIFNLGL